MYINVCRAIICVVLSIDEYFVACVQSTVLMDDADVRGKVNIGKGPGGKHHKLPNDVSMCAW